jgi:hypothetical protein
MKRVYLYLVFFLCVVNGYSQNNNYVLIGDTTSTKVRKLMFGSVYHLTLKKKFIKELNSDYAIKQEKYGFFSARITNANSDTLFLNDSIAVPFVQMLAIESGGLNFFLNEALFFGTWTAIGIMNYNLLLFNYDATLIITLNTVLTMPLVSLTVRRMTRNESLVNFVIKEVRHNNNFNKKKDVFERRLKPPNKQ